jgi:ParB-like chromosome segregation protein Spo0J
MYIRAMTLAEYMEGEGITDTAMGAVLGKSRVTVSRYRRGLEPLPGEIVKHLVQLSLGRMTANELLGIEQPQAAE